MTTPKQSKYGRRFDEEFKREVAALASQPGATIEQVAVDLGVSSHSVARWRRRWRAQNGGAAPAAPTAAATAARPVPGGERGGTGAREPGAAARGGRAASAARDPKKSRRHLLGDPAMRMAMVSQLAGQFPVRALCRALGVSRSAFYAAAIKPARPRAAENARLWVKIAECFGTSHRTYGSPRLTAALRRAGERCSRYRVARIMRGRGLRAKQKRRFRPRTTDANHLCPIAPNRLAARSAPSTRPDEVWAADITYVPTGEGWLYVAGVLDLYSRKLVGWAAEDAMPTTLVARAFQRAVTRRRPAPGLLHHSDRGSQYASDAYRQLLHGHGVETSMSRAGNRYDNAFMESFWATTKTELLQDRVFTTHAEARSALFYYFEVFYNRKRLHGALGFQSPVDYETNPG